MLGTIKKYLWLAIPISSLSFGTAYPLWNARQCMTAEHRSVSVDSEGHEVQVESVPGTCEVKFGWKWPPSRCECSWVEPEGAIDTP
jgi:hypothetical protein